MAVYLLFAITSRHAYSFAEVYGGQKANLNSFENSILHEPARGKEAVVVSQIRARALCLWAFGVPTQLFILHFSVNMLIRHLRLGTLASSIH